MTLAANVVTAPGGGKESAPQTRASWPRARRRVPFIQQLGADDCGGACLAMVLGAHGVHGVAAELRERCGAGRDGTTIRTLASAALRYGLVATPRSVSAEGTAALSLPAIVHWQSRHFVVLERCMKRAVVIVDPAQGRRRMSHEEFAECYSGAVMTFERRGDFVPSPGHRAPLWLSYLAAMFQAPSAQGALAQIVVASVVLQATGLAAPLFTKLIVDDVAPPGSPLSLSIVALGMGVVVAAKTVTTFVRSAVMIRLQARLDARLTEGFFDHLLRLPFRFFQGRSSGDLLMRLSSNTMIREVLTTQLLSLLLDAPLTVVYLVVLTAIAPSFALVVGGLAALQAVLVLASLRPLHDIGQRSLAARSDEQSCLVELMKGIAYVKASGAEQRAFERWTELFRRQLRVFVDRAYLTAKVEVALGFVRSASPLVLLWYGAVMVVSGTLPLGTMLALTALAASFLTPFMSLVQNSQQLQMLEAYVERLTDVLRADPEPAPPPTASSAVSRSSRRLSGAVEARGLTYRFSPDAPVVVDDISFTVRPGEKLGIVGPTGSGKSTVLMLLLGLYRPTAGEIFFDGVPLSKLDPHEVRRQCGVVLQDATLFGGSVHANITLNAPLASRADVIQAARAAQLHDEIAAFAMGYDTRLAESGSNISGGQRQRLAIARALVTRPTILLLDEASSHLDVATEQRLNANLEQLRCTRLVVAHRLTAVRNAHQILVMDAGRVAEQGTHNELMRRGHAYALLAAEQSPGHQQPFRSDGLPRAPGVNAGV